MLILSVASSSIEVVQRRGWIEKKRKKKEDTLFLMSALKQDIWYLPKDRRRAVCLETGYLVSNACFETGCLALVMSQGIFYNRPSAGPGEGKRDKN